MRFIKNKITLIFMSLMLFVFMSCTGKTNIVKQEVDGLKIVSLSPSNTEILVELGLGDNIIGVDEYSRDVEGINEDSETFKFGDPNIEALVNLESNIIFLSGTFEQTYKYDELKKLGVEIVNIDTAKNIDEIYKSIILIGEKTNKVNKANEIVENLKTKIKEVEDQKITTPKRVYFEISQSPYLYSFGKNTFLNEIIEISGGENIFKDLEGWIAPNEESIINANPEIIFTNVNVDGSINEIKNRAGWENIDAVKNNRVFLIDENSSSRPSQLFMNALYEVHGYMKENFDE